MSKHRILLADDHALLLEAFQRLLEPEFEVVGCVASVLTGIREPLMPLTERP